MIKVLKGTKDILPQEVEQWHKLEKNALEIFTRYGYKEIRTPIFEVTELFARGVGDTTDIVNKEMYTFEKSDRSITLRPENTAGVLKTEWQDFQHPSSYGIKDRCSDTNARRQADKDNSIRSVLKCSELKTQLLMRKSSF